MNMPAYIRYGVNMNEQMEASAAAIYMRIKKMGLARRQPHLHFFCKGRKLPESQGILQEQ